MAPQSKAAALQMLNKASHRFLFLRERTSETLQSNQEPGTLQCFAQKVIPASLTPSQGLIPSFPSTTQPEREAWSSLGNFSKLF